MKKYVATCVQLPPDDKKFIEMQATILNISFNQYIRNLILEHKKKVEKYDNRRN